VLLYPEGMVKLNPSAGEIMKRLDGRASVGEVVAYCEAAFQAQDLFGDVAGFLDIALDKGWVRRA
jgi:pyrroloquinoline quinone biosynthesis protein D